MPATNPPAPDPLDIPLRLEQWAGPQSHRVHQGLRDAILTGRLRPGRRLPASRTLAAQLGVRRNAVVGAYEQLQADGLAEAKVGAGTFVAAHLLLAPPPPETSLPAPPAPPPDVFALGRTTMDPPVLARLRAAMARQLRHRGPVHLGYGDPRGGRALRERVAEHLAATRGIRCDPGCVVVTSGTQQGLQLCLRTVLRPGDAAWMEDPGYPAARRALEAAGARLVPVPVDTEGLVVAEGRRRAPDARVAYVTPSHQFPMGVAMRMHRRVALLDWARDAGAWVLEDDYDSEFRYAGLPLMALAGIDGARRVIYFGTFSKVLFPGLRLGYAVVPPPLLDAVVAARAASDRFPPTLGEGAVAELMANGAFAAHLRRMRARYLGARNAVAEALAAASAGTLRVAVPDGGLHLVAHLHPSPPPGTAARVRTAAGVGGYLLSETRIEPAPGDGFVLGFSGHDAAALRDGATRLGQAALAHAKA